ncbi:unnamed protein product [Pneumocystis jirovecii]|uniref:Uncharacterized protein n=2 Tax=Pneumocystis jirovecii TaxID=42068 RepID=L0PFS0_PNEJI|nr:uncharacterized protein T551_01809 [Pneumocystis jirovecii RU7]KTW30526.1 hypothetical protein T551_01809 [Pneumocystis jirovecii RU7]CCJ30480.1 unnamed protein product [Pneumocystis jirovecii]
MKFPVNFLLPKGKPDVIGASDLDFTAPLYIQSSCVSVLISIILGRERSILASENFNIKEGKKKSMLILCGYKREKFIHEIIFSYTANKQRTWEDMNEKEELKTSIKTEESFWINDEFSTGSWILAADNIDIIYVPSLRGLRAILSDYHYSSDYSSENILAIWPFLKIHEASGEFSAQGISKTIALAIEASGNKNLIFCDSLSILSPIQLLNSSVKISGISVCSVIKQITVATVLERWISAFWEIAGLDEQGRRYGIWKYCGKCYKVSWKNIENGEISDIEHTQLN